MKFIRNKILGFCCCCCCDACIINLSYECESSFKSPFYLFPTTNLVFHKPIFFFFTKHIWFFLIKSLFLHFTNRSYFLQTKTYLFILIHKTDLNILFKKKTSFIRKKKFWIIFCQLFIMCVQHIIQHHVKKGILVIRV